MSTTKPVLQAAIQQYAKQLRLPTLGDELLRLAEEAVKEKQSHLSYLEALLEAEVAERDHRAMARRIQEAHFPAVKTLEEFDFQVVPHISVAVMRHLSEGGYLARKEPVIFLGETGTGKTHLATALAVAACRQHKRVRFTTAAEMVTDLISGAQGAGHFSGRDRDGEDALGNCVGSGRLPAAQAGAVYDGGGNGDRTDRSQEPVGANARAESLDALRPDRNR